MKIVVKITREEYMAVMPSQSAAMISSKLREAGIPVTGGLVRFSVSHGHLVRHDDGQDYTTTFIWTDDHE